MSVRTIVLIRQYVRAATLTLIVLGCASLYLLGSGLVLGFLHFFMSNEEILNVAICGGFFAAGWYVRGSGMTDKIVPRP